MSSTLAERQLSPAQSLRLLGESAAAVGPYQTDVTGDLSATLRGTLYRNGPGLFERGGVRKNHLLDGDGFIQALRIADGAATYQSRFVETDKFQAEQAAGRYLTPTWSTLAPGFITRNVGAKIRPQAGVTVVQRGDSLYAFDDAGAPYELDPKNLQTRRSLENVSEFPLPSYNAHGFIDAKTSAWVQFGITYGRVTTLHISHKDKLGAVKAKYSIALDRSTYIHDFFATEKYLIFSLHAIHFKPLKMLLGIASFIECLSWQPELGNLLLVIDRSSGEVVAKIETDAVYMWHSLNAYDRGDEIIADFVGYDNPDHFIGPDPEFAAFMDGYQGEAFRPGTVRRYVINLKTKSVVSHTVADGYHEFPMVDPAYYGYQHRIGYFTKGLQRHTNLHNGLVRIDLETGASDGYDFGPNFHVGEAIYVAKDGPRSRSPRHDQGWLLCQVLDGSSERSMFVVFDAETLAQGPIAEIHMRSFSPISFHGWWSTA